MNIDWVGIIAITFVIIATILLVIAIRKLKPRHHSILS